MKEDIQHENHGSPMFLHTAAWTFKPTWVPTLMSTFIHMCKHKNHKSTKWRVER